MSYLSPSWEISLYFSDLRLFLADKACIDCASKFSQSCSEKWSKVHNILKQHAELFDANCFHH